MKKTHSSGLDIALEKATRYLCVIVLILIVVLLAAQSGIYKGRQMERTKVKVQVVYPCS